MSDSPHSYLDQKGDILWVAMVGSSSGHVLNPGSVSLREYLSAQFDAGRTIECIVCPALRVALVAVRWPNATLGNFLQVEQDRSFYGHLKKLMMVGCGQKVDLDELMRHEETPQRSFPKRATIRFE
jgi:hypothetical protein